MPFLNTYHDLVNPAGQRRFDEIRRTPGLGHTPYERDIDMNLQAGHIAGLSVNADQSLWNDAEDMRRWNNTTNRDAQGMLAARTIGEQGGLDKWDAIARKRRAQREALAATAAQPGAARPIGPQLTGMRGRKHSDLPGIDIDPATGMRISPKVPVSYKDKGNEVNAARFGERQFDRASQYQASRRARQAIASRRNARVRGTNVTNWDGSVNDLATVNERLFAAGQQILGAGEGGVNRLGRAAAVQGRGNVVLNDPMAQYSANVQADIFARAGYTARQVQEHQAAVAQNQKIAQDEARANQGKTGADRVTMPRVPVPALPVSNAPNMMSGPGRLLPPEVEARVRANEQQNSKRGQGKGKPWSVPPRLDNEGKEIAPNELAAGVRAGWDAAQQDPQGNVIGNPGDANFATLAGATALNNDRAIYTAMAQNGFVHPHDLDRALHMVFPEGLNHHTYRSATDEQKRRLHSVLRAMKAMDAAEMANSGRSIFGADKAKEVLKALPEWERNPAKPLEKGKWRGLFTSEPFNDVYGPMIDFRFGWGEAGTPGMGDAAPPLGHDPRSAAPGAPAVAGSGSAPGAGAPGAAPPAPLSQPSPPAPPEPMYPGLSSMDAAAIGAAEDYYNRENFGYQGPRLSANPGGRQSTNVEEPMSAAERNARMFPDRPYQGDPTVAGGLGQMADALATERVSWGEAIGDTIFEGDSTKPLAMRLGSGQFGLRDQLNRIGDYGRTIPGVAQMTDAVSRTLWPNKYRDSRGSGLEAMDAQLRAQGKHPDQLEAERLRAEAEQQARIEEGWDIMREREEQAAGLGSAAQVIGGGWADGADGRLRHDYETFPTYLNLWRDMLNGLTGGQVAKTPEEHDALFPIANRPRLYQQR